MQLVARGGGVTDAAALGVLTDRGAARLLEVTTLLATLALVALLGGVANRARAVGVLADLVAQRVRFNQTTCFAD
jgi:hypothetical protein